MILFPSFRRAAAAVIAGSVSLFCASSAFAISGGPFSNGSSLPSGSNGTYTATMLGNNLVGNMTFAISNDQGSTGRFFIFHAGAFSSGVASGFVDPASGIVTGAFGNGEVTNAVNPGNDLGTGGWQAVVVDDRTFQFMGSGTLTSSASNFSANTAQDNFSVETISTVSDGVTTTETETATATADQSAQFNREQIPYFVLGYRSTTSTIAFPANVIVEGALTGI